MTSETSYREQGRAVFLTAMMVLSVVAMSAAFAGGAAAVSTADAENVETTAGSQSQGVTFTAVNGTDFDDSGSTTPNVSFSETASLTFESVSISSAVNGSGDDVSDSLEANVVGSSVEVQFDESSLVEGGGDIDVDLDLQVDASGASEGSASYSVGGASANFEVTSNIYSPSFAYEGQTVSATPETGSVTDTDYQLREVTDTSDGNVTSSSHIEDLAGDDVDTSNNVISIDTTDLEGGDYFVRGGDFERNPPVEDTFEVGVQTLTTEFDSATVNNDEPGETVELDVDSNRGTYDLNVSANGDLDHTELAGLFAGSDFESHVSTYADTEDNWDEKILLEDLPDTADDIDFTDIDEGSYTLEFEAVDTAAESTAEIEVTEPNVDGSFSSGVYTQTAGDLVEVTLELEDTDDAYVQFGDEKAGFVDVIYVEDDNDDGEATFWVNTRTLGTDAALDDVYHSEDDNVDSAIHGTVAYSTGQYDDDKDVVFWDEEVDDAGENTISFDSYVDDLGIGSDASAQLTRPLQPTDYTLTAEADGNFIVNADGESEANNEIDQATLDLIEPELSSVTTYVAPSDSADEDDTLDELNEQITERTDIAEDDRLVIKAEATGLYGALAYESDNDFSIVDDGAEADALYNLVENNEGEGINFEVTADDAVGNQDPTTLDLNGADDGDVYILVDNDAGEFYVVVDTSSTSAFDGDVEAGQEFDVTLEYETNDEDRYEFDVNGPFDGGAAGDNTEVAYPYFGTDETQTITTTYSIVEPAVTFDNLNEDDEVVVPISEEAEITGTTNVAPGADASLRLDSGSDVEPAFFDTHDDVEITDDGTWSLTADYSDQSDGDTAETTFRAYGSSIDSIDAVFSEDAAENGDENVENGEENGEENGDENGNENGAENGDENGNENGAENGDENGDENGNENGGEDENEDGTPGFGAAVALAAILGAAMLALRRQH
ncbi:BGTF surface domain-containing protein [Halopiger djelfimassiliensis]|uniref:BGTF surface domain-containing protein n=1 Tax=Halopiger djelfimassiliensis TaxID=1293047 RepID=UPI000677D202|nr:BGTF surface domain-containing protein [Halopiger djelfimassiliensis]